ncbi:diguanylate cyclase [Thiosulfativibrio zosterae]|uniref:diguanylate cyclase n=1 Tax=Thiosulfativibrio zosterae TaxID=2675053 RepID=A0A6F8PJT3_9GAMM|nr:diguanylate cyclase [Thiosulfativibrio zosterae]BBP42317.1 hypothetical protein THMIRHAT_00630 [Thiosulfativibrio zosterae]
MFTKQLTILIVDDDPINLSLVAEALQYQYNIRVANGGNAALKLLEKQTIDLILLDIYMPEMDGFEVAKVLKNNQAWSKIPLIFLTSDHSQATIFKALSMGAVDFINKPFQNEELNLRVSNHLKTYQLQKQLQFELEKNAHLLEIIDEYAAYIKIDAQSKTLLHASSTFNLLCDNTDPDFSNNPIEILLLANGFSREQIALFWQSIEHQEFKHEVSLFTQGRLHDFELNFVPDFSANKELLAYLVFFENIDDRNSLIKSAETDELTGLYNRKKLNQLLEKIFKNRQQSNSENPEISLIFGDIDHFKRVNDDYGHLTGDSVLKEFAQLLDQNISKSDFLARWGGEEFLIVCPETDAEGAFQLAEKIRKRIEHHTFETVGHRTASFGVAQLQAAQSLEDWLEQADVALYQAKTSGRNRVVLFKA